jgi:hypothetical protein
VLPFEVELDGKAIAGLKLDHEGAAAGATARTSTKAGATYDAA